MSWDGMDAVLQPEHPVKITYGLDSTRPGCHLYLSDPTPGSNGLPLMQTRRNHELRMRPALSVNSEVVDVCTDNEVADTSFVRWIVKTWRSRAWRFRFVDGGERRVRMCRAYKYRYRAGFVKTFKVGTYKRGVKIRTHRFGVLRFRVHARKIGGSLEANSFRKLSKSRHRAAPGLISTRAAPGSAEKGVPLTQNNGYPWKSVPAIYVPQLTTYTIGDAPRVRLATSVPVTALNSSLPRRINSAARSARGVGSALSMRGRRVRELMVAEGVSVINPHAGRSKVDVDLELESEGKDPERDEAKSAEWVEVYPEKVEPERRVDAGRGGGTIPLPGGKTGRRRASKARRGGRRRLASPMDWNTALKQNGKAQVRSRVSVKTLASREAVGFAFGFSLGGATCGDRARRVRTTWSRNMRVYILRKWAIPFLALSWRFDKIVAIRLVDKGVLERRMRIQRGSHVLQRCDV
ncbi:hypothetical protein C8R44DRAFT_725822 [Mycena epipterygia]|nr:hypothetical protein C8R44DRAFT_725822 [Mycena epipterygia]